MRPQVSRTQIEPDFSARQMQSGSLQQSFNGFVRRQLEALAGLGFMASVIGAVAALGTWSVADPSYSHATGNTVVNALGAPGAILADLFMQFLGLAAIPALLPALTLGFFLARGRTVAHKSRRVFAWIGGALLMAAFFGCFNPPASWPLPVGIGGVLGDLMLKIPGMLSTSGYPTGVFSFVMGLMLIAPATWCLFYACGFIASAAPEPVTGKNAENEDLFDDADDDSGYLALGALTHYWLTMKAAISRQIASRRQIVDQFGSTKKAVKVPRTAEMRGPAQPLHDEIYDDMPAPARLKREPEFAKKAVDEDIEDTGEDYDNEIPVQSAPRVVTNLKVDIQAARPRPGQRVAREAQLSLIGEDGYEKPPLHLLGMPKAVAKDPTLSKDALEQNARMLEGVLDDFGVRGEIIQVRPGPVVTLYELEPAAGIKSSRVIGLADDIARSMSAIAARVAVVPGRNAIGIELPNHIRETVYLRELVASQDFENSKAKLALALGKTINGEAVIADLAKMPHVLVAGTTGSGKSVMINTIIMSLVYRMTPQQCRLIMIDPKMVELSVYDGIPHLLTPVVTDPKKAVVALKWAVKEMEDRYRKMAKLGVRNQEGFNNRVAEASARGEALSRTVQTGFDRHTGEAIFETEELKLEPMPFIVVVIDEVADLMMVAGKDIEGAVQRLGQMARAAGIHVIMATQRPSVDVITGTIKANFPTRISFQVTSKIDSRTILGEMGAEQLLGQGDMLYMAGGGRIQRVHGPFVSDDEVEKIVAHLKLQGTPQYLETITEEDDEEGDEGGGPAGTANLSESDDPYDQAVAIVLRDKKASTSYIQRRMGIGYNRAASLIERMEQEGIVGPANQTGKRDILVPTEDDMM
jgi:DNA segregation ATPase FtsK/SpoIIIE, S-DNA-T family